MSEDKSEQFDWSTEDRQVIRRLCSIIRQRCYDERVETAGALGYFLAPQWQVTTKPMVDYILSAIGPRPSPRHWLTRASPDAGFVPGNLAWRLPSEVNGARSR